MLEIDKTSTEESEDKHERRADVSHLAGGARQIAVINMPQPVAPKTAARISTINPVVSPHFTPKKIELARIRIPT